MDRGRFAQALIVLSLLLGLGLPGWSDPPAPRRGGDFWLRNEETWLWWEVLPKTLAGRRASSWPSEWQAPEALMEMDWVIGSWPVVTNFNQGARLRALPDAVGGIISKDLDGNSWLRVALPDGQLCFVRAHKTTLKPVN